MVTRKTRRYLGCGGSHGGPGLRFGPPHTPPPTALPSRATRSRHRHAVVSTCAREARGSEGDRVLGAEARFPKSEGGDGGRRHAFLSAEGATQASVPARPAAGRGACHSSGVASKSPFKLRDCGDAKLISTRRQRHSLHAARNARILHLTTGGLLDLGTVTSQSPEAAGKGVSLRPPSQCHVTHTHTLSVT